MITSLRVQRISHSSLRVRDLFPSDQQEYVTILLNLFYELGIGTALDFDSLRASCLFSFFDTISHTEKAYGDDGCLKQPKELSINKVGHGKYGHGAVTFSQKAFIPSFLSYGGLNHFFQYRAPLPSPLCAYFNLASKQEIVVETPCFTKYKKIIITFCYCSIVLTVCYYTSVALPKDDKL